MILAIATAVLWIAVLATPLSAQFGGSFGLKGGLSLADLTGSGVQNSDTRQGLNAGGSLTILRLGPLEFGPELYYAQKGADAARLSVESPEMFEQFGLDYLEVPVIGKLNVGMPGLRWLRPYVQGGPAFAWRLDCAIQQSQDGAASLSDDCAFAQNQDARTFIDSADRGVVLGGGIDINVMNFGIINLDARHVRGLARLTQGTADPDVRNRATSLMIGYSFGGFGGSPRGGGGLVQRKTNPGMLGFRPAVATVAVDRIAGTKPASATLGASRP